MSERNGTSAATASGSPPDAPLAARSLIFQVTDDSGPGEVRRAAAALAGKLGFTETGQGEIALIVTELATNLARHGAGGTLILRAFPPGGLHGPRSGLEMLALDRGPGMIEFERCLEDGFSTAGSPGKGLGAIARLADLFEVHSVPNAYRPDAYRPGAARPGETSTGGTVALARLYIGEPPSLPETVTLGAVNLPMSGEEVCGDAWALDERPDRRRLLVVDGLGHGQFAAEASGEAVRVFRERADLSLEDLVHALHAALRSTRGAALAIAEHDLAHGEPGRGELNYIGVGNISGRLIDPHAADAVGGAAKNLISHNGTVGHTMHKVRRFVLPWPADGLLVMHSDGLATGWRLGEASGRSGDSRDLGNAELAGKHPGLIAGQLYRDFNRGRDDVTVVALRDAAANSRLADAATEPRTGVGLEDER